MVEKDEQTNHESIPDYRSFFFGFKTDENSFFHSLKFTFHFSVHIY